MDPTPCEFCEKSNAERIKIVQAFLDLATELHYLNSPIPWPERLIAEFRRLKRIEQRIGDVLVEERP